MHEEYFKQAELAFAAYANLNPGTPDRDALRAADFSASQAVTFSNVYQVIDQHSDATGLSATVFKSTDPDNPQTYLAIRGTNDPLDLLTGLVNIAIFGSTTLQPQYLSLKSQVKTWIDDSILPPSFTVTGHSLGGFLATDLTVDEQFSNNITHAYLYNTPGQGGIFGDLLKIMQDTWGFGTQYDPSKFSNIEAVVSDGLNNSLITGLGYDVSPPINIMFEDQNGGVASIEGARNHSIKVSTDALAVQQFCSPHPPGKKPSGWTFNVLKKLKLLTNINKHLKKLFFGIALTFFIKQNAFSEKYNVNPAIDEDFITWSNSMPEKEAVVQLKDFLSSFNSWEEAKTWFISKGFSVNYGEMNEHVARKHGIYPAFAASASWSPEQGIIFSNGWLQKMESKVFVHGWSVGIRYTENGQFTVHRVKVVATLL